MSDHAAFIAAIVASPDDDLPRLVYADYLDENDEPERAEFIRLQCELERCSLDDEQRTQLNKREQALLRQHATRWTAEATLAVSTPPDSKPTAPEWRFRRGFLHSFTLKAQRFETVVGRLLRVAPTIRAVRLTQGSGAVESMLRTPELMNLTELEFSQMCECHRCPILAELRKLFAAPLVGNLTHLTLSGDRIDPETTAALVSSPHLTGLQHLDLSHNALALGGVRVLAAAKGFAQLRDLNLSDNGITPSGGQVIARAPWLKGIQVLNLSRNRLTDTSGRALLNAEFGETLQRIDLQTNELSREMKKLLKARFGTKVRLSR